MASVSVSPVNRRFGAFPGRALALMLALVTSVGSVVGLSASAASGSGPPAASSPRPNILFILIDDMGWPDLGCYGHAWHQTPVVDRLAEEGVRFTDFYAATPVCSSTRSTIQTGQYSARTRITDFIPGHWRPFERLVVPPIRDHLDPGVRTVGRVLHDAGYVTGYFGKWHLGSTPDQQPDHRGYDVTERQLGADFKRWRKRRENGPKRMDFLTDAGLWFLEQHRDEPFFLTISHYAVHIPVEARPETVRAYEAKPRPATGVNHPVYAAMVADLDRQVGRLLAKLDELGLRERTIVVFTSDNGGLVKNYTGVGEAISTNAPLRDEKGTLYEGGIRVPLIVRWPGVTSGSGVCAEPATTADLLPTFCAVAGAPLPEQPIDGADLTPLLRKPGACLTRPAIYFHYPHYHHSRPAGAIRAGDWKLIEFFDDQSVELYNLRRDLGETTDQAVRRPELAAQLRRDLAAWRERVGALMPTENPQYDPARAGEWWSRRTGKPLNVQRVADGLKTRKPKAK